MVASSPGLFSHVARGRRLWDEAKQMAKLAKISPGEYF